MIKEVRPTTPVIMVTKSEEENIMDKAVGSKIADYLIKPVNPNQVLLSIKKNVHQQRTVTEQTTADYRSEFGRTLVAANGRHGTGARSTAKPANWEIELGNPPTRASRRCWSPEDRGQPGVLQVRTPQLLQLDQQTRGRHPRDVAYAHAHQDLPRRRREPPKPRCC